MNTPLTHDHISFYVTCPGDLKSIWFMLVECQDGRCYLKEEFREQEHEAFNDITPVDSNEVRHWFNNRVEGLTRALEIVRAIRPQAITTDLEDEISLYDTQQ
ncbi:MAG: hypothetical protein RSG77_19605 [Hafnia sp.]